MYIVLQYGKRGTNSTNKKTSGQPSDHPKPDSALPTTTTTAYVMLILFSVVMVNPIMC